MKVLFVCTGNTCRSPMAEALFAHKTKFEVKSAGVYAANGASASPQAIEVLKIEKNISFAHSSQGLTDSLLEWANLVLTMTTAHKNLVISSFPAAKDKIFTLKEYAGNKISTDISDPYGGSVNVYCQSLLEIEEAIDAVIEKLK